ncbi:MAG: NADH-quinone oxidoreductase subunit L [Paludibacteraceae bacterium]|nr:NADH-quinone oxidoreductase subunit L [Paludibacteraceae bacterium]
MDYTILLLAIPFLMFLIIGLLGYKMTPKFSGLLGSAGLAVVTALAYYTAYRYFFTEFGQAAEGAWETITAFNYTWLDLSNANRPDLMIQIGMLLDPISVMMLVVITTVSMMVHIYSMGYMHGEEGFQRYYAVLSLFTFAMLGLVVATNIFQMYIFWELVGVSSFLLISFYFKKPSAVRAAKKAFIVTRFADMFFLIGILILSYYTKTFDFLKLTAVDAETQQATLVFSTMGGKMFMGMSVTSIALLLIFLGGAGKSAMFPFHIWLPDAMEGPTPASALIHAATMVVAGVFLVARLFPVYYFEAPEVLHIIAYIGAFTSLFAAIIACTQTDIKRVLAFSTISQIAYMMVALGVSGYEGHDGLGFTASMWHLFTHAMFKATLFMAAGCIIHAVHSNEMDAMGGLRHHMKKTYYTFAIACFAIAGIFPLSGFFSKDEILVAAFEADKILYWCQTFVAGLTAFYMFRLFFRIFFYDEPNYEHTPHEAPANMWVPLAILSVFTIFSGWFPFSKWISANLIGYEIHTVWPIAIGSTVVALIGIGTAYFLYYKKNDIPDRIANSCKRFYTWASHRFYIDEVYLFITNKIIFGGICAAIAWFDRHIIDGFMDLLGWTTNTVSEETKEIQSGSVQQYAWVFIMGVITIVTLALYL